MKKICMVTGRREIEPIKSHYVKQELRREILLFMLLESQLLHG